MWIYLELYLLSKFATKL
uniref:Uncharacterized protein n=1 Tax=Arundo donax TaxID=35708 RepID=A0A0A9BMF9_ARUDO